MAKITINADTDTNIMEVIVNGVAIDNVNHVGLYLSPSWDDPTEMELNICIDSFMHDKDSGVKTHMSMVASDTTEGRKLIKAGAKVDKRLPEFAFFKTTNKLQVDLANYLGGSIS